MKIYFTGSREGNQKFPKHYSEIMKILKKNDAKIKSDHIINQEPGPQEKNFQDYYKQAYKWIKDSDAVIAEISTPSSGVGHEIYLALDNKKPVLVLLNDEISSDRDATLKGNPSRLLTFKKYNLESLEETIEEFLETTNQNLDTKFILIISPEIEHYLNWRAETKRMHKAQTVREAIEDMMKKDKKYKDFLKSQKT